MLTRGLSGAEYAKGVVRIELRAGRKKLKSLHYKYAALLNPCENWCQELMVMAGLSGKIIEGMMIDMLGTGDFYPMKTILQKNRCIWLLCLHEAADEAGPRLLSPSQQWGRCAEAPWSVTKAMAGSGESLFKNWVLPDSNSHKSVSAMVSRCYKLGCLLLHGLKITYLQYYKVYIIYPTVDQPYQKRSVIYGSH